MHFYAVVLLTNQVIDFNFRFGEHHSNGDGSTCLFESKNYIDQGASVIEKDTIYCARTHGLSLQAGVPILTYTPTTFSALTSFVLLWMTSNAWSRFETTQIQWRKWTWGNNVKRTFSLWHTLIGPSPRVCTKPNNRARAYPTKCSAGEQYLYRNFKPWFLVRTDDGYRCMQRGTIDGLHWLNTRITSEENAKRTTTLFEYIPICQIWSWRKGVLASWVN